MSTDPKVQDHLKEALIDDFIERNPGVTRSQVILRFKNGKPVFDTIDKVMASASVRVSEQQKKELLRKQMEIKDDERYKVCMESIRNSKQVVDFLFACSFVPFGLNEKNEHLNALKRGENIVVDRTHTKFNVKKEFLEMMSSDMRPNRTRIRDNMVLYFRAVLDQLKSQSDIFQREFDLGTRMNVSARDFMKEKSSSVKSEMDLATRKTVASVYMMAKKVAGQTAPKPEKVTVSALEGSLAEMETILNERRSQIQEIRQVVELLEKLIKQLELGEQAEEEVQTNGKSEKKRSRMAFALRLFSR
ncbi:MAG TPA: hypothetical protein PLZ55_09315 [bacterium]|nr:hypothetical protein [bacterium]HPO08853.1 hypothetical protein [bacterium]HQO36188.1 hypothetical protein [bacterium]HQP98742.1 hypothetical protein [bacterium]